LLLALFSEKDMLYYML